ncbi:molybdenum cofactor biosynthesis protein [Cohnella caldifontis]|uniref:molybdenum cofactor biosynthesis protein n=1 Tax=Cohnella caldifontis TaxID=3027471 RepID=UPI0023ED9DF0|nr:molybdenum cofactor biosynthesis protein MoaE [Cohnella sp. YIM B05605]
MSNGWNLALFAGLAERFGSRSLRLDWPERELTAGRLKAKLIDLYPEHAELIASSFVARNQAYSHDEETIGCEDELALLPPVSGGMEDAGGTGGGVTRNRFAVVEHAIDVNAVAASASHPDHGALIAFVGTTREWTGGKRTVTLEYEAYVPMAESAMREIGEEIARRWPGTVTAITHRIGTVGIGEISVVIAVSSPHRAEAYEASRYAIESLKRTVPIWKKEVYEDGTEWKGHQMGPWNPMSRDE